MAEFTLEELKTKEVFVLKPWDRMLNEIPPLSTYEREQLKASLEKYGIKNPILVLPDGRIIDGFHRWELSNHNAPYTVLNLTEDEAFALGFSLNLDRRQLSFEQIREIRDNQRKIALKLRSQGKTQEEVAKLVGVTRQAISFWEQNTSNASTCETSNPLDCRIQIPDNLKSSIYDRAMSGETQESIAADFKISQQRVSQIVAEVERQLERNELKAAPLPEGIYNIIYADPPWQYSNTGLCGAAEKHYETMSLDQLCELKIPSADNAVLFLWVTNPMLEDAFKLVRAWGFEYKTNIVWIKKNLEKPGIGFYVRGRHELLFICIKGSFLPATDITPIGSVLEADIQEHSRKPSVIYDVIEALYPNGRYLELFARNKRQGWESWGNEL